MTNQEVEVFSITDYYCGQDFKNWLRIKKILPKKLKVKKHTEVTDMGGERICRPYRFALEKITDESTYYRFYINTIRMWLETFLKEKKILPNTIISLGKARLLGEPLCYDLLLSDYFPRLRHARMERDVDPITKVLGGFELDKHHHIPNFDPGKMIVVIVEDFIFTGRSVYLAKKTLEDMGAKVIAVVSFTNALADEWPFDVPINLTFLNVGFEKYLIGTCPDCKERVPPER